MVGMTLTTIALALAAGTASAGSCAGSTKSRISLTGLYCTTAATTASSCTASCCVADATKCGGTTVTCDAGKFKDIAKDGTTAGSDATARKTNCCTAKKTCSGYTGCAAGKKVKASPDSTYCITATCSASDASTCCVADTTKCGGNTVTCDAGKFKDSAKDGTAAGADAAAMKANCCTAKKTCSGYTLCAAGKKVNASPGSTYCNTATCSASDASTCCILDTTKCGGNTVTCDTGKFKDASKNGAAAGADAAAMKTNCCTAKAKCSTYTCAALKKSKANAATTNCLTGTCSASDASTCCEADTTKCGGNTVTCGTGKFQDASKNGAAAGADAAAMKTNCCTARATCSSFQSTGQTSAASKPQTLVVNFILALVGAMVLSQ